MNFNKKNRFNFTDDLLGEQAVNKFLVEFFYEKLKEKGDIIDFEVSRELNKQHAGSDVILTLKSGKSLVVDEKAAIHYAKTNLKEKAMPTFAFEVSYMHNGQLKEGWLTNSKYSSTQRYLLCWLWVQDGTNKWRIKYDDIVQIEAIFFEKADIQNYIMEIVTADTDIVKFYAVASDKRVSLEEKILQKALDKIDESVGEETYPKWYLTGGNILSEQPLNILLYKNQLEKLAKSHWLVTRKGLIRLDK